VVVSALKRAEDGGGVILRCYETNGDGAAARIALGAWNRVIETDLGPTEIKTYFVPDDESQPVREVNLVEWDEPSTL
jgi:alpha-mannosidase